MSKEREQESKPIAYWDTQEGKLIPAVPLSSERTCFKVPPVPLYLHPTPRPFIRLTDKEIERVMNNALLPNEIDDYDIFHFARAVEDALEEKNK